MVRNPQLLILKFGRVKIIEITIIITGLNKKVNFLPFFTKVQVGSQ